MLCFCCTAKRISYIYIYTLFFGFPSHLGHHRALSRVEFRIIIKNIPKGRRGAKPGHLLALSAPSAGDQQHNIFPVVLRQENE